LVGIYSIKQEIIDKEKKIAAEETLSSNEVYKAYKKLIHVEQAFLVIKTHSLKIRPVFHHLDHDHRIQAPRIFVYALSILFEMISLSTKTPSQSKITN
jgi:transposase